MTPKTTEERLSESEIRIASLEYKLLAMSQAYSSVVKKLMDFSIQSSSESIQLSSFLATFLAVVAEQADVDRDAVANRIRGIATSDQTQAVFANALLRFLPWIENTSKAQDAQLGDSAPSWLQGVFQDGIFHPSVPDQILDQVLDGQPEIGIGNRDGNRGPEIAEIAEIGDRPRFSV